MVDGKQLAMAGFKYLGRSYEEMDCQKFVERSLMDCGNSTDLTGSNAWYREVMKNGWVGTPEECVKKYGAVPPGAFLFILSAVSSSTPAKYRDDGIGDAEHIGLVTGTGQGAIHSSKSKGGVCESPFAGKSIKGGWNRIGLWNQVDYHIGGSDPEPAPDPEPEPEPEPAREIARVWSENGKPVTTRKGPGTNYPMSKAGRISVGSLVEILKRTVNGKGEEWSQISWQDQRKAVWYCWMMSRFLNIESEPDEEPTILYTVHIPYLTQYQAEALVKQYTGSWMDEDGASVG